MRIQELSLHTRHLAEQQAFYRTTLGFPLLAQTADSFTIQAGTTRLRFQEGPRDVLYHLAFTIPRNTFLQAKGWLRERVSLLLTKNGEDEIFFESIDGSSGEPIATRSLYFGDAANNILELIVHSTLSQETEGPFGAHAVLHVSEIGLPVGDVLQLAAALKEQLDIEPYPVWSPVPEDFAYLGDISGQLVVVKIGRP